MNRIILLCFLAGALISCGSSEPEQPNIEIEAYDKVNQLFGIKFVKVKVRAISDVVVVEDVVVNRGNCKIENLNFHGKAILPKTLKFGETVSVSFSGPCEVAQVDVITDGGSWTATY